MQVKTITFVRNVMRLMPRYRDYHEELIESLKDHDEAVAYLNAAWEESLSGDKESKQLFLVALRNVAEAQELYS